MMMICKNVYSSNRCRYTQYVNVCFAAIRNSCVLQAIDTFERQRLVQSLLYMLVLFNHFYRGDIDYEFVSLVV